MYEIGEVEQIITPDGEVYRLEDGAMRAVTQIGGRGMPGVEYDSFQGYQQPFPVVTGWTLEPRAVSMTLVLNATDRADYWQARAALIQALRFNRGGPFTLRHVRADGTRRDLYCLPDSSPEFPDEITSWDSYELEVELVAYDPLFKDAGNTLHTTQFSLIEELTFPITFPILFQSQVYQDTITITYPGSFAAYPIIEIVGPYEWITLTHVQTGALVGLIVPIGEGEQRIIDLTPREQRITDPAAPPESHDKFGELMMPESNLITFNLRPKGKAWRNSPFEGVPGGENSIWIQAKGVTDSTQVAFVYRTQYLDLA